MAPPHSSHRKKVLLVDDHSMFREGLAEMIGHEQDLAVCGDARNSYEALDRIKDTSPDLVLADISMPGKNGLELIKDIHTLHPEIPVLVISMHDEQLYAERVLRAGGRGYIMKQEGGKMLMQAIRQVLSGKIYVSEKIASQLLGSFSGQRADLAKSPVAHLTDRELEVLQLIGQGKGTREIASQLRLSIKTIEVHRSNIKQKLHLETAMQLVRFAVQWWESQHPG
jgi:DNA-binding NarL/FixJ family response regulator